MNDPAFADCTLVGDIRPSDYLSVSKRLILRPPWMRFAGLLTGVGAFAIFYLGIQLLCPDDDRHLVRIVLDPIIIALMVYLYVTLKILSRANRSFYERHAVVPNMGTGTYEIIDTNLRFSGTMYNCTIPISIIKDIVTSAGTTLLVFSNASGFVIPRTIISGDLTDFLTKLRVKMHAPED
jgi:hypothetical protein